MTSFLVKKVFMTQLANPILLRINTQLPEMGVKVLLGLASGPAEELGEDSVLELTKATPT